MELEKFITITGWAMIALVILALVALLVPIALFFSVGFEIMPIINFGIALAIAAIVASTVYFVAIAIDNIIAWRNEKREADGAELV